MADQEPLLRDLICEIDMPTISGGTVDVSIPSPETLIQVCYKGRIYYIDIINNLSTRDLEQIMIALNIAGKFDRKTTVKIIRRVIRGLDGKSEYPYRYDCLTFTAGSVLLIWSVIVLVAIIFAAYVFSIYLSSA